MATASFTIGGDVNTIVTVTDDDGNLNFTISIDGADGDIADLRGFFLDLDGDVPAGTTVTGPFVSEVEFDSDGGPNWSVNPAGPFDIAIELGTAGIGADDIQSTTFVIDAAADLSVSQLVGQHFGVRLTSVDTTASGEDDGREGSLKITDNPDVVIEPDEDCFVFCADFEGCKPGTTVARLDGPAGLIIRVNADRNGADTTPNDAMLFDADQTSPASGGDDDLLGGDGNVLIISEDNDRSDPDDAAQGGVINFRFSGAVDLGSLDVIDNEEGGRIVAFDGQGVRLGAVALQRADDGEVITYDLSAFDDVRHLRVVLNGSGAVDNLCLEYCVPSDSDYYA